jgi:hypothetical protein
MVSTCCASRLAPAQRMSSEAPRMTLIMRPPGLLGEEKHETKGQPQLDDEDAGDKGRWRAVARGLEAEYRGESAVR